MTFKQKRFVGEYLKNGGNGTQAAMKVYNTDTPHSAHSIASENIAKPEIKRTIEESLRKAGLTTDVIAENLRSLAVAEVEKISADVKLKSNVELLKLMNAYPDKKSYQFNLSMKGKIKDLSYGEAKQELDSLNSSLEELDSEG